MGRCIHVDSRDLHYPSVEQDMSAVVVAGVSSQPMAHNDDPVMAVEVKLLRTRAEVSCGLIPEDMNFLRHDLG